MDSQTLHRLLLDPRTYPGMPQCIEYRETHVSRLYLVDDRVYKIKKPVDFGFLDFTTLELRRHFCAEEVRLNRRFAPGTYLGVIPLRSDGARLRLGGEQGTVVEYAVKMRRLPAERMLDRLLEHDAPEVATTMPRLGRLLAHHHATAPICQHETEPYAAIVQRNWAENFAQTAPLTGPTLSAAALAVLQKRVASALECQIPRLTAREAAGLVRDGHGDLHAEHICLTEPIRIYDCIEFNRRFRVTDILADIAFLLMDLDLRGRRDLSSALHAAWSAALPGADDPELLRFYKIYRAFVRGKVDTFLAEDPAAPVEARDTAAQAAQRYFNLALGYLAPPVLILTCGLMGVGKTSVARALTQSLGALHLRSDVVRKTLAGLPPSTAAPDPFAQGLYSSERTRQTYAELLDRTEAGLAAGQSVVVDASFARNAERERFRACAHAAGVPFLLLHLQCSPAETLRRLAQRLQEGNDPSDGRPELYQRQAVTFTPPTRAEGALKLDTEAAPPLVAQQALVALLHREHG